MTSHHQVGELKRMVHRESEDNKINNTKKMRLSLVETEPENVTESGYEEISINRLDYDCLAKVISYLPQLERLEVEKVCRKWKEAAQLSWDDVKKFDVANFQIPIQKIEPTLKKLLTNCCKFLTDLTIDYQYPWLAKVLENNCNNIVNLNIQFPIEYDHRLYETVASMSKLECLRADFIKNDVPPHWSTELVDVLPANIEEIHFLESSYSDLTLPAPVLNRFTTLRCLTLQRFRLDNETINSIILNKDTLVYLDLEECDFPDDGPRMFFHLVNLEHLNLESVKNFNIDTIIEIARNCPKLKYLKFSCGDVPSHFTVSHDIFDELKHLINLEHLDFPLVDVLANDFHVWDEHFNLVAVHANFMADVVNNCKKLKHFNLGYGENFSRIEFEEISKLKDLEYFNLLDYKIDSQSFNKIARNCFELKEFQADFTHLRRTDFGKFKTLKKLEKLDLDGCNRLTGNSLTKILNNCKNLVEVNLIACRNLTEASLMEVGKIEGLKRLDISCIKNVPNAMFNSLCKLEYLSCYGCPTVTDEGMMRVLGNCHKLSKLDVRGTVITVDSLVYAASRKSALDYLRMIVDTPLFNYYLDSKSKYSRWLDIEEDDLW